MEQAVILNILTYVLVVILSIHLGYSKSSNDRRASDIPIFMLFIYLALAFTIWCLTWDFKNESKGVSIFLTVFPFFIAMIADIVHETRIDMKKETI